MSVFMLDIVRLLITGNNSKTRPKIGKSIYLTALNRARSQGGCEWIFDYISFQLE